ncbi:SGNH/GDSL hydrolase family protein [Spongisporangium articulatum]|uniref:SGNH/GDSL hydrolase family protein n=1 Tax=Spongisporangium articulatum TaxID=3362603 RepID=A0ABW8AK68_9ACTN
MRRLDLTLTARPTLTRSITMHGRRRLGLLAAALLPVTVLAATTLAGGPAQAAPTNPAPIKYVALGDSYSSGSGASGATGPCTKSPNSYPPLWAKAHAVASFTNMTCGGATMDTVTLTQLSGLKTDTTMVTMTVGGNDVGFVSIVAQCLARGDAACQRAVNEQIAKKAQYVKKAGELAAKIKAKAPNAKLYLLGYPYLFETGPTCPTGPSLNQKQRQILHGGVDFLDDSLAEVAAANGFTYVDVRAAFAGHSSCGTPPWITGLGAPPVPLHPNDAGYLGGYLPALTAVTG